MKKHLTFFGLFALAALGTLHAQEKSNFGTDFQSIRKDMVAWDQVRGEWLASSMEAMANKRPTPDRNFPEEYTPAEMFSAMPEATQNKIRSQIQRSSTNTDSVSRNQWNRLNSFTNRTPDCKPVMGRTYGDPHLKSFDGATYSFQTVGEFTLAKSGSGNVNIQVRQRPQSDDFSLNTAVAMNVGGDRVCFYANEKPDGNNTTPLRIEGEPVYIDGANYYLEHGGTISASGNNNYVVTWPTGERVKLDGSRTGNMGFYNIAVEIYPCSDNYEGILGNANGRSSDDFDVRGGSMTASRWNMGVFGSSNQNDQVLEKEYLAFLAKDFAMQYRIVQEESLFDYGFNQSTLAFTDLSFPRVHRTLGDLSQDDRRRAQRECERRGFSGSDLSACMYDNGFLRIEPTPKPTIPNRTTGRQLDPVRTPTPNVNPGQKPFRERYPDPGVRQADSKVTPTRTIREVQPMGQNPEGGSGVKPVSSESINRERTTNREVTTPVSQNPETINSDGGTRTTRPVYNSGENTKPVKVENTNTQSGSVSHPLPGSSSNPESVKPVKVESTITKQPEVIRQPEITRPVVTRPVITQPVRTEPKYTPPPSNPVSTPVQRPVTTPVSTPSSTPSKTISTPVRRGG
ncbi:VWD domain-containing protein [Fluviicola sp.]|uniref:VWD domain-containing protein n=1 Tax=Fluviicola sp. TaxID=1917219 RepID=UPI002616A5A0|nr:VWD domain-containing protein [Fluviicola sp.]